MKKLTGAVALALAEKKGTDVLVMDLKETAPLVADFFVMATAFTPEHARTLSDTVAGVLWEHGVPVHHVEGRSQGRWVLLDAGEIVVHIMLPEAREFYALESLWADAETTRYDTQD